jgi:hypothetical protein
MGDVVKNDGSGEISMYGKQFEKESYGILHD